MYEPSGVQQSVVVKVNSLFDTGEAQQYSSCWSSLLLLNTFASLNYITAYLLYISVIQRTPNNRFLCALINYHFIYYYRRLLKHKMNCHCLLFILCNSRLKSYRLNHDSFPKRWNKFLEIFQIIYLIHPVKFKRTPSLQINGV